MALPNFIIFGAVKGGTSSLYEYCKQHPDIYMSPVKEARFFCYDDADPELRSKSSELFPIRTMEEYRALFDAATNETVIGEASPQYLRSPIAAARIRESIPAVRLLASLRNPVDRIYSGYVMNLRAGAENRAVEQALRDKALLKTGLYYTDVKRYFDVFDRNQIKVVLFEEFRDHTVEIMQEIFRFLAVDDRFVPDVSQHYNRGGIPKSQLLQRLMLPIKKRKRLRMAIRPFIPRQLQTLRRKIRDMNLVAAPGLPQEMRADLCQYYREDTLRLQDLLQKDLSVWFE